MEPWPGIDGLPCIGVDGTGPRTSLLCGMFTLDEDSRDHVLPQLPPLIHVQGGSPTAAWLDHTMRVMADEPAEPWTAATLARRVGLSRTLFYERFTAQVGESPAAYLTRWRMLVARTLMRRTDDGLGEIAEQVGYRSQASFHKAFKRVVGENPGAWRRVAAA